MPVVVMFLVGFLVAVFVCGWSYSRSRKQQEYLRDHFKERWRVYHADFTLDDWVNEWMRNHPLRDHDGIPADVQRLMEKIEAEAYMQDLLKWRLERRLIGGAIPLSIAEMMKSPPGMEQKLFLD